MAEDKRQHQYMEGQSVLWLRHGIVIPATIRIVCKSFCLVEFISPVTGAISIQKALISELSSVGFAVEGVHSI